MDLFELTKNLTLELNASCFAPQEILSDPEKRAQFFDAFFRADPSVSTLQLLKSIGREKESERQFRRLMRMFTEVIDQRDRRGHMVFFFFFLNVELLVVLSYRNYRFMLLSGRRLPGSLHSDDTEAQRRQLQLQRDCALDLWVPVRCADEYVRCDGLEFCALAPPKKQKILVLLPDLCVS
jgi:hypothetical protein